MNTADVVVYGDLIIDKYINYSSTRLSPEAPCPVVNHIDTTVSLGGAGNLALSCHNIGINTKFIFPNNESYSPATLIEPLGLSYDNIYNPNIVISHKTRHIVDGYQFFRADKESNSDAITYSVQSCAEILQKILAYRPKLVLLSDYQKGALTPMLSEYLLQGLASAGVRTLVDTKSSNPSSIKNCWLLKPNLIELSRLLNKTITETSHNDILTKYTSSIRDLMQANGISNLVLTMSEGICP